MGMQRLHELSTELIAAALHYQDNVTGFKHGQPHCEDRMTAMQVRRMTDDVKGGWKERYMIDPEFNARVSSIVAGLIQAIDRTFEEEVNEQVRRILND